MGSAPAVVDTMAIMHVGGTIDANGNTNIELDEDVNKLICEEHTVGLYMNFTGGW